jgi:hypothetical protein
MATITLNAPVQFRQAMHSLPVAALAAASFEDDAEVGAVLEYMKGISPGLKKKIKKKQGKLAEQLKPYMTMGDLRRLCDTDWHGLHAAKELPAMFLVYLQYLARLSGRNTPLEQVLLRERKQAQQQPAVAANSGPVDNMQRLANDFNHGEPIDLGPFNGNIAVLVNMGFTEVQALEALLTTGKNNTQRALDLLLGDPASFEKQKEKEIVRIRSSVRGKASSPSPTATTASTSVSVLESEKQSLLREITKLTKLTIEQQKQLTKKASGKSAETKKATRQSQYAGYVLGLQHLYEQKKDIWERFTEKKAAWGINRNDHTAALREIKMDSSGFSSLKASLNDTQALEQMFVGECVVCLDAPADHVLMECMHMCLCKDCAKSFKKGKSCPICSKSVTRSKRVYMA